jgi:uncharacterized protein YndB with AHSA1/START domain
MKRTASPVSDEHSVSHGTFRIERTYSAPPASVFSAYTEEATKRRWFAEGEGWQVHEFTVDFRVGGAETSRFRYQGGPEIRNDTLFHDIIPNRRIVFVYRMTVGPKPISVSLATVELAPSGNGTLLTYTEQGAFFDDADAVKGREEGCRGLLETLASEIERSI